MKPCPHCPEPNGTAGHVRWCRGNPEYSRHLEKLKEARESRRGKPGANQHTAGTAKPWTEEARKAQSERSKAQILSPESRKKISESRLKWLMENPGKHPWKSANKFKSEPCDHLKALLRGAGIPFEEEFQPLSDRFFSLDIAFSGMKKAVEVNGNQHYSNHRAGILKPYYQRRHDLLVTQGWKILELHYSRCYHKNILLEIREFLEGEGG